MRAGLIAVSVAAALGLGVGFGAAAGHADRPVVRGAASADRPTPFVTPSTPTPTPSQPTPDATTASPTQVLWQLDSSGSEVRVLEARLSQLGGLSSRWVDSTYGTATATAVRAFQLRTELPVTGAVDAVTWRTLKAETKAPTRAQLYPGRATPSASGGLDPRCLDGRVLCIDKTTRRLSWVVDGVVRRQLAVRFGSQFTPTREGAFTVYRMSADHVSNLFGSPMPYAMFFSRGQAVHYSRDFAARGYAGASHGCVNVRDRRSLAALFAEVHVGDAVVVYRG
jgi:peptidoglycan hydrolase-like protein with peptidoglycan-binding domain